MDTRLPLLQPRLPASNVQPRLSVNNTQSTTSDSLSPINLQPKLSINNVQPITSNLLSPINLQPKSSVNNVQPITSNLLSPINLQPKSSVNNVQPTTSNLLSPISLQPRPSVNTVQPITSNLSSPNSLQPRLSVNNLLSPNSLQPRLPVNNLLSSNSLQPRLPVNNLLSPNSLQPRLPVNNIQSGNNLLSPNSLQPRLQPKSSTLLPTNTAQLKPPALLSTNTVQPKPPALLSTNAVQLKSPTLLPTNTVQPKSPPVLLSTNNVQLKSPTQLQPSNTSVLNNNNSNIIKFTPAMIDEDTIYKFANTLDKINLRNLIDFLSDEYHNNQGLIEDDTFDMIWSLYEEKYETLNTVGARPRGVKTVLSYYLGSLNKLKSRPQVEAWLAQHPGPYILEDKMDGQTILFEKRGRDVKLSTRGKGYEGTDVSHLYNYVKFPKLDMDIAISGELILPTDKFELFKNTYKNARNLLSSVTNSKDSFDPETAKHFQFRPFRIMNMEGTPEQHILYLQQLGFDTPWAVKVETIDFDGLTNLTNLRYKEAPYGIDGIVIYQNKIINYIKGENPTDAVAFKRMSEKLITTVTGVVWEASRYRKLVPVVEYVPVDLAGATLNRATAHNASYVVNQNINIGAKIMITRSNEVIPYIVDVLEPSPYGPAYPDVNVYGEYVWDSNKTHFVMVNDSPAVAIKKIEHFFTALDIKGVGPGKAKILFQNGISNIDDLLKVTPEQLQQMPGLVGISNQLYNDIHNTVQNVNVVNLLNATSYFEGVGTRRFTTIVDVYPNFVDLFQRTPRNTMVEYIRALDGFDNLAYEIVDKMPDFIAFLKRNPEIKFASATPLDISRTKQNLVGQFIIFSGKRDKKIEEDIKYHGGNVLKNFNKSVTMLVIDNYGDSGNSKYKIATERGVPIFTKTEFSEKYLI